MAGRDGSTARRALRLALVVAVLCLELAVVMGIYHLDDPVDAQQSAVAAATVAAAASVPDATQVATTTELTGVHDAPGADTVAAAARQWLSSGADPDLATLRGALADSQEQVSAAQGRTDLLVFLLVLALFLVICVGWFSWFAKLVKRHRELEHRLTEKQAVDAGERRLLALVHNSADLVAVLDADSFATFVSPASRAVLGYDAAELSGRRLVDLVVEEDRATFAQLLAGERSGEQVVSLRMQHHDGRPRTVEGTLNDLHDDPVVAGWVLTVRDVSERRRLEDELTRLAFHDSLTGLANRQLFGDRLDHALRRHEAQGSAVSVLFLDLDDFKLVNDTLGHEVGDELLVEVSRRIADSLGELDTAARLGGDEFAVLLEDTDALAAQAVADRLLATLRAPVVLDGHPHQVRASIGVAEAGTTSAPVSDTELMRNADVAMYLAKDRGKGGVAVYDPGLHTRAMELLALRSDLRDAIARDELVLHYQATVDLVTQQVSGFEALVRWLHPERGLIPPVDFIPVAERSGLIVPLGAWVLREACRSGLHLQEPGRRTSMAVNVSPQQLADPGFEPMVLDVLRETGFPADLLVLEITETALLDDLEAGVAVLNRLRRHGLRVAIDDFGTGYSSLSNLSRLPIDVLKVDKSFVDPLGDGGHDSTIVEAVLAMASSMGLSTVAEGVERPEQARWLQAHGAVLGQGFVWSRPVALDTARQLVRDGVEQVLEVPSLTLVEQLPA